MAADENDRVTIPIAEETATVAKRTEVTGTVRVQKRVSEREEVIDEPLVSEEIEVQRVPVDRFVDGPVPVRQEGDTTIISVLEEVPVVEKRLKVIEEVHLTKRRTTRRMQDQVTLRRENVEISRSRADEAASDRLGDRG